MPFNWDVRRAQGFLSYDQRVLAPCVAVFGEAAQGNPVPVCTPLGGAPVFSLDGIFDDAYLPLDVDTSLEVVTAQPRLAVRISQYPPGRAPAPSDQWLIRGTVYVVRAIELDGKGEAGLLLNRN